MRPHPDDLLRGIEASEARERRGRLKIFLGYAARVGKSERMFEEGLRRRARGQDVIVVPLRDGSVDVDAILRRGPEVCLIDELARPNRWREVERLLAVGINVITAVNLQHVFEQQDAVARITGKRAADSVPEAFIRAADEIVVVDAPAGLSSSHAELRELALLLAAEVVEDHLQVCMAERGIRQSWGTQERILVCITPRSSARPMLESAARSAERFHGRMYALNVVQRELNREGSEAVAGHMDLARRLGAEVHTVKASDPIGAIIEFAREQRITQLFVGHTRQPVWQFWKRSPVERLIADTEGADLRLFPPQAAAS